MKKAFFISLFVLASGFLILFWIAHPLSHKEHKLNLNTEDYFVALTKDEMPEALDELSVSSCEEFLNTYFNVDENDSKRLIQPIAYDSGLCVPQDLEKARNLYEGLYQEQENADHLGIFVARLALIYSYGPQNLRDSDKASFYFKQAVIYSAIIENRGDVRMALHAIVGAEKSFPDELDKELNWLEHTLGKSKDERQKIADKLSMEGYQSTDYLAHLSSHTKHKLTYENLYNIDNHADRIAILNNELEKHETDSPFRKFPHYLLGNIYADPDSEYYSLEEARHNYYKSYMTAFWPLYKTKSCIRYFESIPGDLIETDIHRQVLQEFTSLCSSSNEELFEIAAQFEKTDKFIAFMILKRIRYKLTLLGSRKDNQGFKKKIRQKMEELEEKL